MKTTHLIITTLLTVSFNSYAAKPNNHWNTINDPTRIVDNMESNIHRLPLTGSVDTTKRGWGDYYWANVTGGIAYRWQAESFFKKDKSPSFREIKNMSQEEINLLSPAEKFDAALDLYKFPLATSERKSNGASQPSWRGICHGWSPASIQFDEPQPKVITNKQNISIPFTSSDIKSLLAYYIARVTDANATLVGTRCNLKSAGASFFKTQSCTDINPASLHLILTNMLGLKQKAVIADIEPTKAVWNYPLVSYESKIIRASDRVPEKSTPGTRKIVEYETTVLHPSAIDPEALPVLGTKKQVWDTVTYKYILELNANDDVIGGTWIKGTSGPDFVWILEDQHKFSGKWSALLGLLN